MTVTSQNGYPVVDDRARLKAYDVGGRVFWLHPGAPGWLLWHFLSWFDANIRDINPGVVDDWSWAVRPVRGSTDDDITNHASGTAADVDATRWPLGAEPTSYLTPAEIARVRAQLKTYGGAIRWGGDYTGGRKDPMHFEINKDEAFCDRVRDTLEDDMALTDQQAADLSYIKAIMAAHFDPRPDAVVANSNGETVKRVREIQSLAMEIRDLLKKLAATPAGSGGTIPPDLGDKIVNLFAARLAG